MATIERNMFCDVFEKMNDSFRQIEKNNKPVKIVEMSEFTKDVLCRLGGNHVSGDRLWSAKIVINNQRDFGEVSFYDGLEKPDER